MKSITCPADLKQYGITCLTGEACNLGIRILCEVDTIGARLVKECYGITALGEPWNNGIGSFMLPADEWRTLAIICLLSEFPIVALSKDNSLYGMENEPRNDSWVRRYYRSNTNHPHLGTRNVHTFTGRVE